MNTLHSALLATLATTFLLPAQEGSKPKAGGPAEAAGKTAPAGAPLAGVVDLNRALEQYPKWIKMQGDLKAMQDSIKDRIDTMTKAINELQGAIQLAGPDSDERKEKEFQAEMLFQQRAGLAKVLRNRLNLEHARALLVVYEDLEVAIAKVAEARGVAIVLRMHNMGPSLGNPAKLPEDTVKDRVDAFDHREVLFANKTVDLTSDLIKLLMVPLEEPKDAGKDPGKPAPEKAPAPAKTGG